MIQANILPEVCYNYKPLSLEEIFNAHVDKTTITGHVEKLLPEQQLVVVRLGDDIIAHMSYKEASIYPLHYSKTLSSPIPTNIFSLTGKNIRIKVLGIGGPFITVSRKANMHSVLSAILKQESTKLHIKRVDQKCAFGDIGDGIIGRIPIDEISKAHIKSAREYLNKNTVIPVKTLDFSEEGYVCASYKQVFKPYNQQDYTVGTTVIGKVCDYVHGSKEPGFYVHITPQVSGIMDVKPQQRGFKYGTLVECLVKKTSKNGLHLEFSKFI